jgi:uncharacterized membrane protein SpoIIM required for sporulation/uncharacterized RDD family membrane protein YckC
MHDRRESSSITLSRRISVETPEHVILSLELAGMGSRMAAGLIDSILLVALLSLVSMILAGTDILMTWVGNWAGAFLILIWFCTFWGYFVFFEALGSGRTPGKRRLGIRVVMDTGHPVTIQAALVRNLIRLVDLQPLGTYGIGLLFVFFSRQHKRLGDTVAGTIVVRDRPQDIGLAASLPDIPEQLDAGPPALSDDEFRLLDQLISRLGELLPEVRARFVTELAERFADRLSSVPPAAADATIQQAAASHKEIALVRLHEEELVRRSARSAGRDSVRGRKTAGSAQRFVASRRQAWEQFRERALQLERDGIRGLSGEELTTFAAEYRMMAADLARARTYRVDQRVLTYVERIVGAGHNALYGLRGVRRLPVRELLLVEFPAAVYHARIYVAVACLLFMLPGTIGYVLVRERPDVVHTIIPDGMIARAESGEYQRQAGRGYAEAPSPYLPLVASSIITNNVQVAFGAFALGITAGIGTALVLAFNGLFFGAILGMFANYGLAAWILTFVAGHGVLELTAIFVAGGAGLLVGRALIAPGNLTRGDALVVHGRLAIRMVGGSACLLLLAGTIEGFLSASEANPLLKLGVCATSLVLAGLYFEAGRRAVLGHSGSTDSLSRNYTST